MEERDQPPRAELPATGDRFLIDVAPGPPRSGIREIMDLASTLDDVLHLEIGEPDFPTPPHVVEAVQRAIAGGHVRYTVSRGVTSLRELIAAKRGVDADRIVVTAGGTPAIFETMMVLLRAGDAVLLPDPGWPAFTLAASLQHAEIRRYPVPAENGFLPDLDALDRLAAGARLLVVNSPNNPTGAVYDRATLEAMYEIARRHGLAILSDEVYEDIVFDGKHVGIGCFDDDGRVVCVYSFSKGYAMTGWRIGYLTGPPQFVEAVVKVQEPVLACPSSVAQCAAEAALSGPQDVVATRRAEYQRRRDAVVPLLREHGLFVAEPRGTFYVMANVAPLGDDTYAIAKRLLLEERVGVAPGETFGPRGAGLVRLSLAGALDDITEAVRRIGAAVARAV